MMSQFDSLLLIIDYSYLDKIIKLNSSSFRRKMSLAYSINVDDKS